jgi:peptide/nickel transport system ATP-binding protein
LPSPTRKSCPWWEARDAEKAFWPKSCWASSRQPPARSFLKTRPSPTSACTGARCSRFNQFFTIRSQLKSAFGIFKDKPSKKEMEERVDQALRAVNIEPPEIEGKYPFELSGGQMQRMLLARIFILRPKVLIADEPTSMVDACVRANILDYLMKLKEELAMTIVFITHDIGLAYYVSDRIFIMHKGKIVEDGKPDDVALSPKNEHTQKLLDDIPDINKQWIAR